MGQESEHSFLGSSALESLQGWVREWARAEVSSECSAEEGLPLELSDLLAGPMPHGLQGWWPSACWVLAGGFPSFLACEPLQLCSLLHQSMQAKKTTELANKIKDPIFWDWITEVTSNHFGCILQSEVSLWASPHSVGACDDQEAGVFSSDRL